MSSYRWFGPVTPDTLDLVCRAIVAAMAEEVRRQISKGINSIAKTGYDGRRGSDVTTSADLAAQAMLVRLHRLHLPHLGLIGEEDGLQAECDLTATDGADIRIICDPLDGTRTLVEKVNEGEAPVAGDLAVMLAVTVDGKPVAAYILDVVGGTWCMLPPGGWTVAYLVNGARPVTDVRELPRAASLAEGMALLRGRIDLYSPLTRRLIQQPEQGGAFGATTWSNQSIGLNTVRLLTGEFTAMVRSAGGFFTPWDDMPLFAMYQPADIVVLKVAGDKLEELTPAPIGKPVRRNFDALYIPRRYLPELRELVEVRTLS